MTQALFDAPKVEIPIPSVMGLAQLAKLGFDGVDLTPIWQQLSERLDQSGTDVSALLNMCGALMDMSLVDQMLGNPERGLALQAQALHAWRLYELPAQMSPAKLRVLGFAASGLINVNTPIEFLIEGSAITLYLHYIVPGLPLPPVPDHDLAIVLVAEGENNRSILQELEGLVAEWPCPVLNRPERVPQMGRERLYKVLAPIPDIEIPATVRIDHATLARVGEGEVSIESILPDGGFPLIARPLDSHAGQGLEKIEDLAGVGAYLSRRPETAFHLSRFVDYRSPDGLYRKYRIIVIEGKAFPCHLAISNDWMVHYLNAGMLESAERREEEADFMNRFREAFGHRHARAIADMATVTGLDYFGIDCAETPDGKLLVFEASTALVIHNMDDPKIFSYKGPQMRAVFDAFRAMLFRESMV